ncbi:PLP-dependent aminotransferase family protein [Stella sp.]|uniref:aminotransferase-like domain-containing protein n=1 Tax=Stella sp. TaxID=2912054 RepID=UPI0035B121DA
MKRDSSTVRVTQHLRRLVAARPAGARLPSVRALMAELGVSPVTVQKALDAMVRDGVLDTRPGLGTFVAARPAPDAARPADFGWQSLALGPARSSAAGLAGLLALPSAAARTLNVAYLPEEMQPTALLAAASARAVRRPGIWGRMPSEGVPALRAWFAARSDHAYHPREVTICPGTQAGIAAAFRALAAPGEPVLVETPTYLGAIAAAFAAGLAVVPVPTDADGVRPDLLLEAFRRTGARLFYCQPTFANPAGTVLPPERRRAVLAAAAEAGAFVVEDDWARDFAIDGEPPPPLAAWDRDGHVVQVRSLTKCAAPGLRVGAICARGAALERLRLARMADDFFVPGILQETALELVSAPGWTRHLRALRAGLRQRRDALAAAVRRHLGADALQHLPAGGLHLWVALPAGVSDIEVERRAAARDILVTAGRHWHPAEAPGAFLRLSFATADPAWAEPCMATLAEVVREADTNREIG